MRERDYVRTPTVTTEAKETYRSIDRNRVVVAFSPADQQVGGSNPTRVIPFSNAKSKVIRSVTYIEMEIRSRMTGMAER